MVLTPDQIRLYFEQRLKRSLPLREKVAVKCPFHDDVHPSATVFLNGNGGFNCNGCGVKGNLVTFEMHLSGCDLKTAEANVVTVTGASGDDRHLVAVYDYRRVDGTLSFQKRRYETADGKTFVIYHPQGKGWALGLGNAQKVLYNLPIVVTANLVFLTEGEKCADSVAQLSLWPDRPDLRTAATTNFEGAWQPGHAPKWLPQYSQVMGGKYVVIFEDNDEPGRTWAEHIAQSVSTYAESVRKVNFRDLPEKSDVADFLKDHSAADLAERIQKTPAWKREQEIAKRNVFVDFSEFADQSHASLDWLVSGVIERGSNGFIAAEPKSGKSFATTDLCIALATGSSWLDFSVPRPVKVGLISREDNPHLTAWRLRHLMDGKSLTPAQLTYLGENLYVNSRSQTPTLMLDNDEEMDELYNAVRERQIEILFFDVLNVLHMADENNNTEMTQVMAKLRKVQIETGASVGVIHHYNKGDSSLRITQRLRGASAIAGFAEWLIGISVADEEARIRRMEFELKSGSPPAPIHFCIDAPEGHPARIHRVATMGRMHPPQRPVRDIQ